MFPVTFRLVRPGSPVMVTTSKFDVDSTFRVAHVMNGIARLS